MLIAGCAATPATVEEQREVVLAYVAHDVGTAGPFAKGALRELDTLSEKDRKEAAELLARGAKAFVVIERDPNVPNRIVLLSGNKVVGDFPAPKKKD